MVCRNSGVLLRKLFGNGGNRCVMNHQHRNLSSSNSTKTLTLISSKINVPSSPKLPPNLHFLQQPRHLSSDSASASAAASAIQLSKPSDMAIMWERKEVLRAMEEVKDGRLPAVFYFSRHMCFPGITVSSPTLRKLRQRFPHVAIYKIITHPPRQMGDLLWKLNAHTSPTFHFYQNGEVIDEICRPSADLLIDTFEKLYRYVIPVEATQPASSSLSSSGERESRTQQLVIQAKKHGNDKGVVEGWKVGDGAMFSQRRGVATLPQFKNGRKFLRRASKAVESGSSVPSLQEVMQDVESLHFGESGRELWSFAKGLFTSLPEKRVIFSKVTDHDWKRTWLLDEMAEE